MSYHISYYEAFGTYGSLFASGSYLRITLENFCAQFDVAFYDAFTTAVAIHALWMFPVRMTLAVAHRERLTRRYKLRG
jgi:hypothetical protein